MFKNYVKIALRNLMKHKGYSLINIGGLSIGLALCIVIFLFVQNEMSYESFLPDSDQLYRVESRWISAEEEDHWATTTGNIVHTVRDRYPEVTNATKVVKSWQKILFHRGDIQFSEANFFYADTTFFDMFKYEFVYGTPDNLLRDPADLVITESIAKKYFGNENPLGQTLSTERSNFTVKGVIKDLPVETHMHFDFVSSLNWLRQRYPQADDAGPSNCYTFVEIPTRFAARQLHQKATDDFYIIHEIPDSSDVRQVYSGEMIFRPISDIHLHGHAEKELESNGSMSFIYVLVTIAIFVLVIACINYMNLATARSARRAREVGIRKVSGAMKRTVFYQFMGESFVICIISVLFALLLVEIALPFFNDFSGKTLSMNLLSNPALLALLFGVVVVVGILSGTYPSIFLANFNPSIVLKTNKAGLSGSKSSLMLRRGLVIFQFALSVLLIIGALTIYRQLMYIQNKELGFSKDQVVVLPLAGRECYRSLPVLTERLMSRPDVVSACPSDVVPGERVMYLSVQIPELTARDPERFSGDMVMRVWNAGMHVVDTYDLEIVDGRGFSEEYPSDTTSGFLLNEAAVEEFQLENPVGKDFAYTYNLPEPKMGKIVGVVKDFHYASMHTSVEPLMIQIYTPYYMKLAIRVKTDNIKATINGIRDIWKETVPGTPFDSWFLDESYDMLYKMESKMGTLVTFFTTLAILIACLGLFALASYMSELRTKEIAVRKIMGATVRTIVQTLSKEFVILVTIANILAFVPAWFILNNWLNSFAYRINLSVFTFVLAAGMSFITALVTVSFNTLKAAMINPAIALKYE